MRSTGFLPIPLTRRLWAARHLVAACCLIASLALPLRANPPLYRVMQTVHAGDLSGSDGAYPVAVTGLNAAGQLCGYCTVPDPSGSAGALTPGAFFLDPTGGVTNLNSNLYSSSGSESSVATCLSEGGVVAGVCWSGSDRTYQDGFVSHNGTCTEFGRPPAASSTR